MGKDKRFVRLYKQSGWAANAEIWVDTVTGVNYLYICEGYSGGLTPLLGKDGKPVVSTLPLNEQEYPG